MDLNRKVAKVAGLMSLFYIATGIGSMVVFNMATGGAGETSAKLVSLAQHAPLLRLNVLLNLITFFIAITLAVSLYVLTRDQNHYLAKLALCCRATESIFSAISAVCALMLLSVLTAPNSTATQTLGFLLLQLDSPIFLISASCFAVGSTIYSYLFLRARSIPVPLAWLGVIASLVLVVELPLQFTEILSGLVTQFIWLPMFLFEVTLALWFLVKGINITATQ